MDPLDLHHVIRHPMSRIQTNNFQDKSGCSINGFRSFLLEEGIVQDLDDVESLFNNYNIIQDYRGCPIQLDIYDFQNYPLSDEILRMKNVRFYFRNQSKPIHKLVSPEPHFVEEEMNLIENHFSYLEPYNNDNYEDFYCFQMDCEGHLVSIDSSNFQFSNESIGHLSNFPHLKYFEIRFPVNSLDNRVTNLSLLSDLKCLSVSWRNIQVDPELFQDLGLFSNLMALDLNNGRYCKFYNQIF